MALREISKEKGHNFHIFSSTFLRQNLFKADGETRKTLGESRGDASPKKF